MISIENLVMTNYGEIKIVNYCIGAGSSQNVADTFRNIVKNEKQSFEPELLKKVYDFIPFYNPSELADVARLEKFIDMLKKEQ